MITKFVETRIELTKAIEGTSIAGLTSYRVRAECNCRAPHNRRDGLLVLDESDILISKVIRCKGCAKGGKP